MNMEVWHGLASCCSVVDPDVVPGGMKFVIKRRLCFVEHAQQIVTFQGCNLEKTSRRVAWG